MAMRIVAGTVAIVLALAAAGCGQDLPETATLGADAATGRTSDGKVGDEPLADARGRPIPPPPVPAHVTAQAVRASGDSALATWVVEGRVLSSTWTREGGWSAAQPLEEIYGAATDVQLASNGRGVAMAIWRHTVGSIQSLRFSRFEPGAGWSRPDVMPGALPQDPGADDGPRLEMDADGNATASWPSGFHEGEVQMARYVDGRGWTEPSSQPIAAVDPTPSTTSSR